MRQLFAILLAVSPLALAADQPASAPDYELGAGSLVYVSFDKDGAPVRAVAAPKGHASEAVEGQAPESDSRIFSVDLGGGVVLVDFMNPGAVVNAGVSVGEGFLAAGGEAYGIMGGGGWAVGGYLRLKPVNITKDGGLYVAVRAGRSGWAIENYGPYDYKGLGLGWEQRQEGNTTSRYEVGWIQTSCASKERSWLCDPQGYLYGSVSGEWHWVLAKRKGSGK
ncbi:MAG: hypothetical protein HY075_04165 [Deltaproteobacteria bacterium]|nr:hypothetical protein [Deltaproteobacteria bacterium]